MCALLHIHHVEAVGLIQYVSKSKVFFFKFCLCPGQAVYHAHPIGLKVPSYLDILYNYALSTCVFLYETRDGARSLFILLTILYDNKVGHVNDQMTFDE